MQTTDAAEYLIKKLRDHRERIKDSLLDSLLPQDEYSRLRGLAQGLESAVELIQDLAKQVEEDDG
jgi:hypothetical protein